MASARKTGEEDDSPLADELPERRAFIESEKLLSASAPAKLASWAHAAATASCCVPFARASIAAGLVCTMEEAGSQEGVHPSVLNSVICAAAASRAAATRASIDAIIVSLLTMAYARECKSPAAVLLRE